ncbi:polymorphic toxin-type HINT domain-containing protein [Peribacillus frigoritolerans]|uniref:polymorphic toxin-type HINT domain-containing protein n=1 Tax=Peribacillus frigoritolerans TaxID=450367 RepID=UPI003D0683A7
MNDLPQKGRFLKKFRESAFFSRHLSISILDCGRRLSKAKDLVKGDLLETSKGTTQTIDEIKVPKHVKVYNFKVKDYHSYYVSNLGI